MSAAFTRVGPAGMDQHTPSNTRSSDWPIGEQSFDDRPAQKAQTEAR